MPADRIAGRTSLSGRGWVRVGKPEGVDWAQTGRVGGAVGDVVPGLPVAVAQRIRQDLGKSAEKIISCLRTAADLIAQAGLDGRGLRFAESAAYNLREALDAVVQGKDAAAGGLDAVLSQDALLIGQQTGFWLFERRAQSVLDRVQQLVIGSAHTARCSVENPRWIDHPGAMTQFLPYDATEIIRVRSGPLEVARRIGATA